MARSHMCSPALRLRGHQGTDLIAGSVAELVGTRPVHKVPRILVEIGLKRPNVDLLGRASNPAGTNKRLDARQQRSPAELGAGGSVALERAPWGPRPELLLLGVVLQHGRLNWRGVILRRIEEEDVAPHQAREADQAQGPVPSRPSRGGSASYTGHGGGGGSSRGRAPNFSELSISRDFLLRL